MYDRTVRRRRLTLAGFVALSLILLTAWFGESSGGVLHSLQRGALAVLSPIQEGANRAISPVRDAFGWAGDTIDAKSERDRLERRARALEEQVTQQQFQLSQYRQLKAIEEVNAANDLERFAPVRARVNGQSPSLFYSEIFIDKGSSAGIEEGQPVTGAGGLVGRVANVTRGASTVTLITDEEFAVSARTTRGGVSGTIRPEAGTPGDLIFEFADKSEEVEEGDRVVSSGSGSLRLPSYFPAGIPIGKVRRIEDGAGELDREIHVRPAADITNLQYVTVLTSVPRAELTAAAGASGTP